MTSPRKISVVKTAQKSDALKLIQDGRVAGSVKVTGESFELCDHRGKAIGSYASVDAAISAFEEWIDSETFGLDI